MITTAKTPQEKLHALFDAERTVRQLHDELVAAERAAVLELISAAVREAHGAEEEESSLRLVRLAGLLGEMTGDRVVDLLIDVLESERPEARHAAGESLTALAFDRFKEVALGVERALTRLAPDSPALPELPFVLLEVPEPGVAKLLRSFLRHPNADVVASAIEAAAELGDPSLASALKELQKDERSVDLEDEAGESDRTTIGKLAREACAILADNEPL